jgi:hypothetical protein
MGVIYTVPKEKKSKMYLIGVAIGKEKKNNKMN